jgi:hypothetical protein
MDTMTWEILAAALLFVAGNVAYFEMALPSDATVIREKCSKRCATGVVRHFLSPLIQKRTSA